MTTPVPSPAEQVTALLDQLDELRATATPGGWLRWTAPDVTAIAAAERATESGIPVNPARWVVSGASGLDPADAACIVAEHNAIPALLAAVRAGLAEHQPAGPCSCDGRRWTEDANWSPPDWLIGRKVERTEGDGLIPCGFCNHGGWNTEQYEPDERPCEADDEPWPCTTYLALSAPLAGQHTTDEEGPK